MRRDCNYASMYCMKPRYPRVNGQSEEVDLSRPNMKYLLNGTSVEIMQKVFYNFGFTNNTKPLTYKLRYADRNFKFEEFEYVGDGSVISYFLTPDVFRRTYN